MRKNLIGLFVLAFATSLAEAQEDDFPPGVDATYSVGETIVRRVDPDIAFDWGNALPDARLSAGAFKATWSGNVLVRQPSNYRFHVFVHGRVSVSFDGQEVVSGQRDSVGWISGDPVSVEFGDHAIDVEFERTSDDASIALFWSSDTFDLEPIPAHILFRDVNDPGLRLVEEGRTEWEALRCNRCHKRPNDDAGLVAPSLTHLRNAVTQEWIVAKLTAPHGSENNRQMPSFGFSPDDANAVAVYLLNEAETPKFEKPSLSKNAEKDLAAGHTLLRSTGCLACHTSGKLGMDTPFGGGDLAKVGEKRSAIWLDNWLRNPERLNRDHRMPVFKLTTDERRQIVMVLTTLRGDGVATLEHIDPIAASKEVLDRGRELVIESRCVVCHRIEAFKAEYRGVSQLVGDNVDWTKSCVVKQTKHVQEQPHYAAANVDAIKAFVASRAGSELSNPSEFDNGSRLLARQNCLACHERDGTKGIAAIAGRIARSHEPLNGQSQGLIPPALTAVGDKMLDEALGKAVNGEQATRRLPWLHVRMPRFRHTDDERKAMVHYLKSHDRIPDNAPRRIQPKSVETVSAETLIAGHTLVGAKGLSCIACHKVRDFEPKNVALGTRGSDLFQLGKRIRPEFYLRWTRSAIRVVPGMEMPSYIKAVPGLLDENIDTQLMATWDALNDPRFTAPTNPGSVEQLVSVGPGEPARIVRDVFTNPESNGGGYIARSMAIGLNNGHNLLFDLDTFSLRQWTFGDLGRQRTQGKSWFWDMAGVPIATAFDSRADIVLRSQAPDSVAVVEPTNEHNTNGWLTDYERDDDGVRLRYTLNFDIDGNRHPVTVTEHITPNHDESKFSFWVRDISVGSVPSGFDVLVERSKFEPLLGKPTVDVVGSGTETVSIARQDLTQEFVVGETEDGQAHVTLRYVAHLVQPAVAHKVLPKIVSEIEEITTVPGFTGTRLPIDGSIMPTAMTWRPDGTLAFTSLKGHVYLAHDTNSDGLEDSLTLFAEGLAAPFGIIADGDDLIVAHKPEVIRLRDTNGDGQADQQSIVATGWGYNENYHDWTCGIVRDSTGNLYVGLGSDYAQKTRPKAQSRWRGSVLKITPDGDVGPVGFSFRYPVGLAIDSTDNIFVSDNQGVQNTFNEVNHLVAGHHYGVPSRHEEDRDAKADWPAIQVPHAWTRSVNGLCVVPKSSDASLADHGIGCEYDSRFLVRFTRQKVGDVLQGATYYLSRPNSGAGGNNFVGPICCAVSPTGAIYVGSIHDSGWLGGQNTGTIAVLNRTDDRPNGIRELRATNDGFEIEFFDPIDSSKAADPENYSISGYTRVWSGGYASPDSERHRVSVRDVKVASDGLSVRLHVDQIRPKFVYDVTCGKIGSDADTSLWPTTGHYTMRQVPAK